MALNLPKRMQGLGNTHDRSKVQEARVAKDLGGRTTIGSGNKTEKADVRVPGFVRVECKNTKDTGYRVTGEAIRKLEQAAVGANEIPIMQVEVEVGPDGKAGAAFCVMPIMFMEIVKEIAMRLNEK